MRVLILPLVTLFLAMLLFLLVAEGMVRLFVGSPLAERLPLAEVVADADVGFRMVPDSFHYSYSVPVQLNSLGFRGPQLPASKAVGEIRLLALGDSHVYGQGVADEQLMTTRLEGWLNQSFPSCKVRVVNLGVRGYSLNQESALLAKFATTLQGDQVLLFSYLNDFIPTDINRRYRRFRHFDSYIFDLSDKAAGEVLQEWQKRQVLRHSALLMWGHDLLEIFRQRNHLENRLLQGIVDDEMVGATKVVAGHMAGIAHWSREHALPVTVIPVPAAPQLVMDFPQEKYQSFFSQQSRQLGLGYLDPLPVMREQSKQLGHLPVLPYDGHYDGDGQEALAMAVLAHFRQTGLVCP